MLSQYQIRVTLFGFIIMSLFFSKQLFSNELKDYHRLADNQVHSENFELIKLIHGHINAVIFHEQTQNTIVFADNYLWKINNQGYIIDAYRGTSDLYDSGLQLSTNAFQNDKQTKKGVIEVNDWIHSGSRTDHKIMKLQTLKDMSETDLTSRFDKADAVEFLGFYDAEDKDVKVVLLKEGATWSALDLGQRFGELDDHYGQVKIGNMELWNNTSLQGYKKKRAEQFKKLVSILPYQLDLYDENSPLQIKEFDKQVYHFEEGFWGWLGMNILAKTILAGTPGRPPTSYWYGTGFFELKHESEILKFKAFATNDDEGPNLDNLSIYNPPLNNSAALSFLRLAYIGGEHNYYDRDKSVVSYQQQDVGLYVVRKKSTANIVESTQPWIPEFTGDFVSYEFMQPIWGNITFFDADESRHYMISETFAYNGYQSIPKSMSVHWPGPDLNSLYKLHIDDNNSIWLDFRRFSDARKFELGFDEAEIRNSFSELDTKNGAIRLVLDINKVGPAAGMLSVVLQNNEQKIKLEKIDYTYAPQAFKDNDNQNNYHVILKKLEIEYNQALSDKKRIDDFLLTTQTILEQTPRIDDHISKSVEYSVNLFMHYLKARDYHSSNIVIQHFINKQASKLSEIENQHVAYNKSVFASQGIVLSLVTNNEKLGKQIFDELLGKDFKVSDQINATLMYNLASYYAVHDKKDAMIAAMNQAIALGKPPEQFTSDADFKNYQDDADFAQTLKTKMSLSPEVTNRLKQFNLISHSKK